MVARRQRTMLLVLLLLVGTACQRLRTDTNRPEAIVLDAMPMEGSALAPARFEVRNLPEGHGYQPGRLLALYGESEGLPDLQPVGAAEIVVAFEHGFELVAWWVDPTHEQAARLEVREMPQGHHFGGKVGQIVVHQPELGRVRLNMGENHGLMVGDVFEVLGDTLGDADLGGRSLGRKHIGLVQVVTLGDQIATADILMGEAPNNAFVIHKGTQQVSERPIVKVLLTTFGGDRGDAYTRALHAALGGALEKSTKRDIVVQTTDEVVTSGEQQATLIGEERGVHVVLWGSASHVGSSVALRPKVTFIGALDGAREWAPVELAEERMFRDEPDEVSRRVQGLASYLAGWMYFTYFENVVTGSYRQAAVHFEAALEHGDAIDARNARVWLFYCRERTGDWVNAEQLARAVEQEGEAEKDVWQRALGLYLRAQMEASTGRLDDARQHAEQAARLFSEQGDSRMRAVAIGKVADVHTARGEFDEALRIRSEEQLPVYVQLRDTREYAVTMGQIADLHTRQGQFDQALRILTQDVLPVFKRLGDAREYAIAMGRIADIHHLLGDLDEALRIRTKEQLPIYAQLEDVRSQAVTMGKIADIHYLRGEFGEALRIRVTEELPIYDKLHDVRSRAATMRKIASIHSARDEFDVALRILTQDVLPVDERLGAERDVLTDQVHIAVILLMRNAPGDRKHALDLLETTLHEAERMEMHEAEQILDIMKLVVR
jgi:tetratricopeptide (TPR) repeat protein